MEWYDAMKLWPSCSGGGEPFSVIVDGWSFVSLKDEYHFNDAHKKNGISICIKFFCLVSEVDLAEEFSIANAIIYDFKTFCCNYPEASVRDHEEYLQKIGCHPEEFLKFANPGSLYATWDTVTRWQYIKPEEEK
jgi:hypothetical protein